VSYQRQAPIAQIRLMHTVGVIDEGALKFDFALPCELFVFERCHIVTLVRIPPRLHSRIEKLSAARLRRGAIRVHDNLFVAVVRRLQHRARRDVHDSPGRHVDALRWVAEIHRQRPGQDDERLLLDRVSMASALRAGRIAPHAPARMREREHVAQARNVARNPVRLWLALDPFELFGRDNTKAHAASLPVAPPRVG
jgi:hypothetical protein